MSGGEQLDGLLVDQSPEVLKGDVLLLLHTHLLQELTQSLLLLHRLQQQAGGGGGERRQKMTGQRREGGGGR